MIKHIASLLISCNLLLAQAGYAEEIYKQVDENGVPSFSDSKSKNAEKIIVEPVNVQKMPIPDISYPAQSSSPAINSLQYRKLAISSPADQATIRNEPTIFLAATVEPGLRENHRLEFLDNGQLLQPASKQTSIVLTNFERGEHNLSTRVVDNNGNTIQESKPITVYVFRATVQQQAPAKKPAAP